ncbi:replication initiator protein [Microviridae sp.]|nr:replication initiator protein [Microviridae sp.]
MPCHRPQRAWRSRVANETGKYPYVFKIDQGYADTETEFPCGSCPGCRIERSREHALRCIHEASQHDNNSFITLTYEDDPCSLEKSHFQKFMKRLRKSLAPKKIRYYMCGEYGKDGDLLGRAHFHAIIFNHQFDDLEPYKMNHSGDTVYISPKLEKLWTHGYVSVGECNLSTAGYVARYCMKKINGEQAESHYQKPDLQTGELKPVIPEYNAMSNGIGKKWLEKYWKDCIKGYITLDGTRYKIPKYYINQIERLAPNDEHEILIRNMELASKPLEHPDNTIARRSVREQNTISRINRLKRNL